MERVRKAVAAAATGIAAIIAAYTGAISDGTVTNEEWGSLAGVVVVAALGTYGVWRVPNEPEV